MSIREQLIRKLPQLGSLLSVNTPNNLMIQALNAHAQFFDIYWQYPIAWNPKTSNLKIPHFHRNQSRKFSVKHTLVSYWTVLIQVGTVFLLAICLLDYLSLQNGNLSPSLVLTSIWSIIVFTFSLHGLSLSKDFKVEIVLGFDNLQNLIKRLEDTIGRAKRKELGGAITKDSHSKQSKTTYIG